MSQMLVPTDDLMTERTMRKDTAHRLSLPTTSIPETAAFRSFLYLYFKTAADCILALVILALTLPIILIAGLLIKLSSPGPALFTQIRVGRKGLAYKIYKLRTMRHDCEKLSGPKWSTAGDPRITPLGRLLRRTHIDELPQLWNVVRGEMSLVGPRPERPEFVDVLADALPHYRDRLLVKPGMTGLAQVQLPPDTDLASVRRKLACDLYYVHHVSLLMDLKVFFGTAFYLAGIPFSLTRAIFRMPSGEKIESGYRALGSNEEALPQLQTA
jgi:lipopolysaccharide/colanic/teichoic acid biosynthesis glycosyltransferase